MTEVIWCSYIVQACVLLWLAAGRSTLLWLAAGPSTLLWLAARPSTLRPYGCSDEP
jgi:hypothetical protein